MDIMTNEQTIVTLTLPAQDALDLFSGAQIVATSKQNIERLSAIFLTSTNGVLTAAATDRFRLLIGELNLSGAPEFATRALGIADVKRIIATLKDLKSDIKRQELTLSIAGDIVSVAINGVSLTLTALDYSLPPYRQLFTNEHVKLEKVSFNPNYMSDFGKVPNNLDKKSQLVMEFTGENKPISIKIPHDKITWSGLLMPMKEGK